MKRTLSNVSQNPGNTATRIPIHTMTRPKLALLSAAAMVAFAGNSILCRLALSSTSIDPASFTSVRLLSGAGTLLLLLTLQKGRSEIAGNWISATALLAYAAAFSFAYVNLSAATGALLLFGSVQATMIGAGLLQGERLSGKQSLGLAIALLGLAALLLPGLAAPPLPAAALMGGGGVVWGLYSLRGRRAAHPIAETAGNFLRATPLALLLSLLFWKEANWDLTGVFYGILSGAIASGLGYALWYAVLPALRSTTSATLQLSVPAIAAIGGALALSEPIAARTALASLAILGGVALYLLQKNKPVSPLS